MNTPDAVSRLTYWGITYPQPGAIFGSTNEEQKHETAKTNALVCIAGVLFGNELTGHSRPSRTSRQDLSTDDRQ
jgi:hypothetical protein